MATGCRKKFEFVELLEVLGSGMQSEIGKRLEMLSSEAIIMSIPMSMSQGNASVKRNSRM